MKNRSIQFTKTLLIPLIACLAVFFSAAAAQASEAPFVGVVSGYSPADLGGPLPGSGVACSACPLSTVDAQLYCETSQGPPPSSLTPATELIRHLRMGLVARWSIYGLFAGHIEPTDEEGVFNNFEVAVVSGGTCRFANATGYFTLGGQINFITSSFEAPFKGRSPGRSASEWVLRMPGHPARPRCAGRQAWRTLSPSPLRF